MTRSQLREMLAHVEGQSRSWQMKIRKALRPAMSMLSEETANSYADIDVCLGSAAALARAVKEALNQKETEARDGSKG